jgi:6-phosphogluconolactonase
MSAPPTVVVHRDPTVLANAVAARLVTAMVDAQAHGDASSLVVPGGGIGIASLTALRDSPARPAIDWPLVDVWWGDERFVAADSPDRNERQAREALLDAVELDPSRVHPMGALGGPDGDDLDAAADRYAAELAAVAPGSALVPAFDVLMLGMGPEGHTASIFPESPAAYDERTVIGVHGCPKPPPSRITMGFTAIQAAQQVWMIVAGEEKAHAVALALSGAGRVQVPAAGAVGRLQTLWLLDEAAASQLPRGLRRL